MTNETFIIKASKVHNKKTYGELYNETINRELIIKNNNYNL